MSDLDSLTPRELWQNIMHYRRDGFDRMPVSHWGTGGRTSPEAQAPSSARAYR